MWDEGVIENHNKATRLVNKVKDEAIDYIKENNNCSECDVAMFIMERFKEEGLRTDDIPMVAFRENTTLIHYEPKKNLAKKLNKNSLIMIDLWAGLKKEKAPFTDITWMAFYGDKIPKDILQVFDAVKRARECGLDFIKVNLKNKKIPLGMEIHNEIKKNIDLGNYSKYRSNYTGHSIGFNSSHGIEGNLNQGSAKKLLLNQGYALEPEIDYKDKFGIRLELNFYIDSNYELVITTHKQNEITFIQV